MRLRRIIRENGRWQDWLRRVRRRFWQWRSSARAVIACEVLIGVLTLHGGRRTAFGDEIVAQALGYRKFLRRVTQSQLQSRLAQDSQYFYRILPYAEAMGLGRSLARTLGDTALEQYDWYQGAKPVPRTAAGFYSSLREALSLMEMSIRN